MRYKEINVYNFKDIIELVIGEGVEGLWGTNYPFSRVYQIATNLTDSDLSKTEITALFKNVSKRILDRDLVETEEELTSVTVLTNINCKYMFLRWGEWLKNTYPRYKALIDAYTAKSTHLLDKVDVESTHRNWVNDTPQSENLNSASEDLTHLTTFVKDGNTESSDFGTPMQRIGEIEEGFIPPYQEWADEFIKTFHLEAKR